MFLSECKISLVLPEIVLEYFETGNISPESHASYRAGLSYAEKNEYEYEEYLAAENLDFVPESWTHSKYKGFQKDSLAEDLQKNRPEFF